MQRLKESCNFLASVPGLPCAQKVEEKEGGKNKKSILQKQIQFQTLSITLILAGGSLLFCFCLDEQIYYKKHMGRDCIIC